MQIRVVINLLGIHLDHKIETRRKDKKNSGSCSKKYAILKIMSVPDTECINNNIIIFIVFGYHLTHFMYLHEVNFKFILMYLQNYIVYAN